MSGHDDEHHVTSCTQHPNPDVSGRYTSRTRGMRDLGHGRPSRPSRLRIRPSRKTRCKVRFSPYPNDHCPSLPWCIGSILDDMAREDFPFAVESPEEVQSELLRGKQLHRRSSRTGPQSRASLKRELLNLSPSPTPTSLPFFNPTASGPSYTLPPRSTGYVSTAIDDSAILAEIKKSVHPILASDTSLLQIRPPPSQKPHTPTSLSRRRVTHHNADRRENRACRITSSSLEEDYFYGRPTSRWLLPELTACCSTPLQSTTRQTLAVPAKDEDENDAPSIPPLGLAMRKGDYRALARRIAKTTSETSQLGAVCIMPHSPKKKVEVLHGLKRHRDHEKSRQFKKILHQEGQWHFR